MRVRLHAVKLARKRHGGRKFALEICVCVLRKPTVCAGYHNGAQTHPRLSVRGRRRVGPPRAGGEKVRREPAGPERNFMIDWLEHWLASAADYAIVCTRGACGLCGPNHLTLPQVGGPLRRDRSGPGTTHVRPL